MKLRATCLGASELSLRVASVSLVNSPAGRLLKVERGLHVKFE